MSRQTKLATREFGPFVGTPPARRWFYGTAFSELRGAFLFKCFATNRSEVVFFLLFGFYGRNPRKISRSGLVFTRASTILIYGVQRIGWTSP